MSSPVIGMDQRQRVQELEEKLLALRLELASARADRQSEEARRLRAEEALRATETQLQAIRQSAESIRQEGLAGFSRYADRLSDALRVLRSQRAWTLMVAVREAYARWHRGGPGDRMKSLAVPFQLVAGRYVPDAEFDAVIPDPLQDIPLSFEIPVGPAHHKPSEEIARLDYLILPIFDFEFRYQRPQQIAAALAKNHHRVYWVSPSRPSTTHCYQLVKVRPNLWEVRIPGAPFDLYGGELNPERVAQAMAALDQLYLDTGISESAVLVQFPFWRRIALELRQSHQARISYDMMDDWKNWTTEPLIGPFSLSEQESLVGECDVFSVTAKEFQARYAANRPQPLLVPNGTDFEFFHHDGLNTKRLQDMKKPVIGYYGAISTWFDLELMEQVVRSRPQYTFVLIGGVHKVDTGPLQKHANVHLLGEKNYKQLPPYLAAFDVCLIPFRINTLTKAVDPVKFYEYLSQGKPVVSTPMTELQPYSDLLYLAGGAEAFAEAIDQALSEDRAADGLAERRLEFARANSWRRRTESIDSEITNAFPKVSVLVVTFNSERFIRPFADSLIRETTYPNTEFIFVDNCSEDGTMDLLQEYARIDSRFRVEQSESNLGFAGGNNLAASRAGGEYLIFLNPDTIVTRGWIGRLLRPLWRDETIGMTSPVTNFSANETKIDWNYRNLTEMRAFAADRARKFRRETMDLDVAPLMCGAIRRSLWETVGELDTAFEVGMFEDDDFCLRIRKAGFRIVTAEDCFVHHFGNGSFSQLEEETNRKIFMDNRARFEAKWNQKWQQHTYRPGVRSLGREARLSVEAMMRPVAEGALAVEEDIEPTLRILKLHPSTCVAGQLPNPQPDGTGSIAVECEGAVPGTGIEFDGLTLFTYFGDSSMVSAIVPAELLTQPRAVRVRLVSDLGKSGFLTFAIVPPK